MKTIALDQNKWIELREAMLYPNDNIEVYEVLEYLIQSAQKGKIQIPLHYSNIYETYKIYDTERREPLSYIQSVLSQGTVFVGRNIQRKIEVQTLLRDAFNLPKVNSNVDTFTSKLFWESVGTRELLGAEFLTDKIVSLTQENPQLALFTYLNEPDVEFRNAAIRKYSNGISELLKDIEKRRQFYKDQSLSMRRRILGVHIWMENQDHFWEEVDRLGISTEQFKNSNDSLKRDLIRKVPSLNIERELTLKLESEDIILVENDTRDMMFFCSTIPICDIIVAERPFTERAKQANLGKEYKTELLTNLGELLHVI